MNYRISLSLLLIAAFILSACGSTTQVRPGDTLEVAFDKANNLYERGRYGDAARAFETVVSVGRGTDIGRDAQFLLAWSYFNNNEFIVSASEFQRYAVFYPRSDRREEAEYMEGFSYYKISPRHNLDQSDTYRAIESFQLFLNRYPGAERAEEVAGYIDELRTKLARKQFEAAEQYMRLRQYNAAAIYYGLTFDRFPETKWAEVALSKQILAYVEYAELSVRARQEERFQEAINSYESYIQIFARGASREQAELYYDRATAGLAQVQSATADAN